MPPGVRLAPLFTNYVNLRSSLCLSFWMDTEIYPPERRDLLAQMMAFSFQILQYLAKLQRDPFPKVMAFPSNEYI